MRNYIQEHKVKKYQAGGMPMEQAPMEDPAMAQQGGGDPMMELMQAGMQALETQDCEMGFQVLAAFLDVIGGAMQGGGEAPAAMAMGGPVMYKKGGKFVPDGVAYGEDDTKVMKKGGRAKKAAYGKKMMLPKKKKKMSK